MLPLWAKHVRQLGFVLSDTLSNKAWLRRHLRLMPFQLRLVDGNQFLLPTPERSISLSV